MDTRLDLSFIRAFMPDLELHPQGWQAHTADGTMTIRVHEDGTWRAEVRVPGGDAGYVVAEGDGDPVEAYYVGTPEAPPLAALFIWHGSRWNRGHPGLTEAKWVEAWRRFFKCLECTVREERCCQRHTPSENLERLS